MIIELSPWRKSENGTATDCWINYTKALSVPKQKEAGIYQPNN